MTSLTSTNGVSSSFAKSSYQRHTEEAINDPENFVYRILSYKKFYETNSHIPFNVHSALCQDYFEGRVCSYAQKRKTCKFSHDIAQVFARNHSLYNTRLCISKTIEACTYGPRCHNAHFNRLVRMTGKAPDGTKIPLNRFKLLLKEGDDKPILLNAKEAELATQHYLSSNFPHETSPSISTNSPAESPQPQYRTAAHFSSVPSNRKNSPLSHNQLSSAVPTPATSATPNVSGNDRTQTIQTPSPDFWHSSPSPSPLILSAMPASNPSSPTVVKPSSNPDPRHIVRPHYVTMSAPSIMTPAPGYSSFSQPHAFATASVHGSNSTAPSAGVHPTPADQVPDVVPASNSTVQSAGGQIIPVNQTPDAVPLTADLDLLFSQLMLANGYLLK